MKRFYLFFAVAAASVVAACVFVSCENYEMPHADTPSAGRAAAYHSLDELKISKNVTDLTVQDAENLARIYKKMQPDVKSSGSVREVIAIKGENGEPAIYAVNFDDGYILVSATKKYYPVLAEVPHGSFSEDDKGSGEDVFIEEYLHSIADPGKANIDDDLLRILWMPFESEDENVKKSSDPIQTDEFYKAVLDKWLMKWYEEGKTAYYLFQKPENIPDDVYDRFCEFAESMEINGYDYMQCSIITEHVNNNYYTSVYGPMLQTEWGQREPFNSSDPAQRALGCTTIAAGQIMRYFEHPEWYSWNEMPDNTSNAVLSDFLFELRTKIGVDDGGGANISEVRRALQDYGYSCAVQPHNPTDVNSSIAAGKPVCMTGFPANGGVGHAWVCDGSRSSMPYVEYELFVLVGYGESLDFMATESHRDYMAILTTYHMNWGWSGTDNGWYTDNHTDYSYDRENIIIK